MRRAPVPTRPSFGQPAWTLACGGTRLAVTVRGGHLAPVTFRVGSRKIEPLAIAPWWNEAIAAPPILQVLRGDFFCLPFGGNARPFRGRRLDVHGETANRPWEFVRAVHGREAALIQLQLPTRTPRGLVEKIVEIRRGHSAVYQRHILSGMTGRINPGHHAMLQFRSPGLVSTSPIRFGQVYPGNFESPAASGYQSLKPGAEFDALDSVPALDGTMADLSRYPAREGFEDLVMVSSMPADFAWTAVVFPSERWLWIAFKDPATLASTVLWHSNGGRHYAPWNGRHRGVLGLEEVTSHFHDGMVESVRANALTQRGIPTSLPLSPKRPTAINMVMAVAAIPTGFDHVATVERGKGEVIAISRSGRRARIPLDLDFLHER